MCSDSIHDSVWCAERRGRTRARSIDAAIVKGPKYGCDCRLASSIYRHSLSKRSQKRRCVLDFAAYLEGARFDVIVHFAQNSVEFARGDITLHPLVPLVIVPTVEPRGELSARSSNESCSIGVLIYAKLGANNRRRPRPPRDLRISP